MQQKFLQNQKKYKNKQNSLSSLSQQSQFSLESFRTKTQKAISLINKHEQQKYNFLKTINNKKYNFFIDQIHNDKNDHLYSIVQVPEIMLQESKKVQLLPYTDQMYKLINPFWVRYNSKKQKEDKNIGLEKDQNHSEYNDLLQSKINNQQNLSKKNSNISQKSKTKLKSISKMQKNKSMTIQQPQNYEDKLKIYIKDYRGSNSQLYIYFFDGNASNPSRQSKQFYKSYSHKYMINNQKIITILIQEISKKWIYIRMKSQNQLIMFTLRIQEEHFMKRKLKTQTNYIQFKKNQRSTSHSKLQKIKSVQLKRDKSFQDKKQIPSVSKLRSISLKSLNTIKKQIQSSDDVLISPLQKSISLSPKINKQMLQKLKQQQKKKKKQQQLIKSQQISKKKQALDIAKIKQAKLRKMALQVKKLVEIYKGLHEDEIKIIKKMIPPISLLMILPKFNYMCNKYMHEHQKGMKMAWKTRQLTRKFARIIKRKYKQAIEHIKTRKNRQLIGIIDIISFLGKILFKKNIQESYDIFYKTLKKCEPSLRINQTFQHATEYRRKIRFIQKTWLSIYRARMLMFQTYVKDQTIILFKKYPHFQQLLVKFNSQNVGHILAYKYINEQSSKVKYLFEQYNQKIKQIQQFKQMNNKIAQFNKTALKKRQKQYLQIPKSPFKPYQRYFRNLSFLKGSIRGWFELEYRKISRVNKLQKTNIDIQIKIQSIFNTKDAPNLVKQQK